MPLPLPKPAGLEANSPHYSTGDQQECNSKQEAEALHQVQRGCKQPVKEAVPHEVGQARHAGDGGKQGTCRNSTPASGRRPQTSLQVAVGDWLNSNAQFVVSKAEFGDSPCSSGPSSLDILEVSTGEVVM